MKYFITGATGFIGEHLVHKLASEGHIIHAIYRSESKIASIQHKNIKWFKGDIMDVAALKLAMTGCEQVFHIAALAAAWEKKPGDFQKFNVNGTVNVIETAKECAIMKIVVTSTAGIFGPSINKTITEKSISPLPHFTGYESSKAECERVISKYVKQGMNIVIVNPTRVFGPGALSESNSVTIMMKKYIEGKWHFIPGNGQSIGNYAFVDDIVNGHILAMQKGIAGERYILGGENISYIDFFRTVKEASGKSSWTVKIPLYVMLSFAYFLLLLNKIFNIVPAITPAHIRKFNYNWKVSSEKAIQELGYTCTSFKNAVSLTISKLA
jgi:nucleoside-diphosphate-sugar epimerase